MDRPALRLRAPCVFLPGGRPGVRGSWILGAFCAMTLCWGLGTPGPVSGGPRDLEQSQQTVDLVRGASTSPVRPGSRAPLIPSPEGNGYKVWIYFTDKAAEGPEPARSAYAQTESQWTNRALLRRARRLGTVTADLHDLPVARTYVEQVRTLGARVVHESRWLNAVSVFADAPTLEAVAGLPFVARIVPVRGFAAAYPPVPTTPGAPSTPSTPSGPRESHGPAALPPRGGLDYGASLWQLQEINAVAAHDAGYSGQGVLVAMFDTGFAVGHRVFAAAVAEGRVLAEWDFVNHDGNTDLESGDHPFQNSHGTNTWSTLGGFENGRHAGPAYGSDFILAKTEDLNSETPLEEDNWVAAAEWADSLGAEVISSSLAYIDWYTPEVLDGDTAVITVAADIAASRGIVVVTSAGNWGADDWHFIAPPADGDSVIAVGAVDSTNVILGFSGRGPTADGRTKPEVVARGWHTACALVPASGAEYGYNSGTSLSCPLVAGAAALVLEAHPTWSPMAVRQSLMSTADHAETPDNDVGHGRIDVLAAIDTPVEGQPQTPLAHDAQLISVPNPFSNGVRLFPRLPSVTDPAFIEIFDVHGRRLRVLRQVVRDDDVPVVFWDGTTDTGDSAPAGVYYARARAGDWRAETSLVRQ